MIKEILNNVEFGRIMERCVGETFEFLLKKGCDFEILADTKSVEFSPPLPENLSKNLNKIIMFALGNYTLETARISGDRLVFNAGFGKENFESEVSIPFYATLQILVDEEIVLVNLSKKDQTQKQRQTSKDIFSKLAKELNNDNKRD